MQEPVPTGRQESPKGPESSYLDDIKSVRHEFVQPLTSIAGYAKIISSRLPDKGSGLVSPTAQISRLSRVLYEDDILSRRIQKHVPDPGLEEHDTQVLVDRLLHAAGQGEMEEKDIFRRELASMTSREMTAWCMSRMFDASEQIVEASSQIEDIPEDIKPFVNANQVNYEKLKDITPFLVSIINQQEYKLHGQEIVISDLLEQLKSELMDLSADQAKDTQEDRVVRGYDEMIEEFRGVKIFSDPGLIRMVMGNYFKNASKFRDSRISINGGFDYGVEFSSIWFTVSNDGRTISPEDQGHIWERGYRGESSKGNNGYGHGLYLARKAANYLQGEVAMASSGPPSIDTTFSFRFPANLILSKEYYRKVDPRLTDITSAIAHEFRNKLTHVIGSMDLILEDDSIPSDKHSTLSQANRKLRSLEDILDWSQPLSTYVCLHKKADSYRELSSSSQRGIDFIIEAFGYSKEDREVLSIREELASSSRTDLVSRIMRELIGVVITFHEFVESERDNIPEDLKHYVQNTGVKYAKKIIEEAPFFTSELIGVQYQPDIQEVNFLELVEDSANELDSAGRNGTDFNTGFQEASEVLSGINIRTDPGLVRIALENFFRNANYYREGSRVGLRVAKEDGFLIVQVSNDCLYMDPQEVDRLWEKDYRGTTSVKSGGSGIGLYLVKKAAKYLGGDASAKCVRKESEEDLGEITFTFEIPITPKESVQKE